MKDIILQICSISIFWALRHDTVFLLWILLLLLNIWCPTVQIIWIARKCLSYAESKLSAPSRPCSLSVIIHTQPLAAFLHVFELGLKCGDNSHEQNTKTKTATCSKRRASPISPNFCVGFSCSMFDKKAWQLHAVAQLRLLRVLPTPTPVTQLAFCFSDG